MSHSETASQIIAGPKSLWAGRIITALLAVLFGMSGIGKLMGGPGLEKGMADMGLPASMVIPLAILELTCLAIYLIPQTAVVGAILLTGYMGGAICTHWRVGEAFIPQIIIGALVWLGIYLREPRLWALIPTR